VKDKIQGGELEKPFEEQADLADVFEQKVSRLEVAAEKDQTDRFRRHPKMREFRQKVWSVKHPEEALPDEQGSDIVFMTQNRQDFLCPITRALFQEPMLNRNCGHHYSKEAILQYLSNSRGRGKDCPVAGCNAKVTVQSLEKDEDLERKVKRHKQEQQKTEQEDTSEEEI